MDEYPPLPAAFQEGFLRGGKRKRAAYDALTAPKWRNW
jgi:hypothetical protein